MAEKEPEKWLKIEIAAPAELMDALGNFLTETGAQGVFQESATPEHTIGDFPEPIIEEIIKAYFPQDVRSDKKIIAIHKYLDSLQEIFPDLQKPSLKTEIISDPDWGEQWKKYFKPIRVCNNIIVKPTWERYAPSSRDIVIEIDPGMAFGTGQHASTRMCMEAIEDVMMKDRFNQRMESSGCRLRYRYPWHHRRQNGRSKMSSVWILIKRLSKLPVKTRLLIMWKSSCAFPIKMSPQLMNRAI